MNFIVLDEVIALCNATDDVGKGIGSEHGQTYHVIVDWNEHIICTQWEIYDGMAFDCRELKRHLHG